MELQHDSKNIIIVVIKLLCMVYLFLCTVSVYSCSGVVGGVQGVRTTRGETLIGGLHPEVPVLNLKNVAMCFMDVNSMTRGWEGNGTMLGIQCLKGKSHSCSIFDPLKPLKVMSFLEG